MSMNHDGATAGVTFMIWLQKNGGGGVVGGYPGWGGGTRPVFGYWFETLTFFRTKKS